MKRDYIIWTSISAAVMLLLPWLLSEFAQPDAGMLTVLILFFLINPTYSVFIGVYAGKKAGQLWGLPVITAVMFLLGAWGIFKMGESAFIMYTAAYIILGTAAMLISMFVHKKIKSQAEQ